MTPLTKKLLRDLWAAKGPAATIALVVGLGISGLMGFLGLHRDLLGSRAAYYQEQAYAHVQLSLRRAPLSVLEELEGLPGIEALEARVVEAVSFELPGEPRRLSGTLLSLPEFGAPVVNRPLLLAGRLPRPGRIPEVLVIEDLAKARGLRPGSALELIVEERTHEVVVSGIAMSPEFVYVIPDDGGFVPDPANFGIFWARRGLAEQLTGMAGAFDDLVVRVGRGSTPRAVRDTLDRRLERYGVLVAADREDMAPYMLLQNEINLTLVRAFTVPSIFLIASALVLNLVLTRLVATQRVQIGTMKALGLSDARVLVHYVSFALAISLLGAAFGVWGGYRLNTLLVGLYQKYYHLPFLPPVIHADITLGGVGASVIAALAGILRTCQGILELTPAEAMRPSPPETRSAGLMPALTGLPFLWRVALRNLLRHPFRSGVACLGVALGIGLMMTSRFFLEGITEMNMFRFRVVERQDLALTLTEGAGPGVVDEVMHLPGVEAVEVTLHHPFEVVGERVRRRVVVEGYDADAWMHRPRTLEGEDVPLPEAGILLGAKLAETLGVGPGDEVELESLKGRRLTYRVRVAALYPTYLGRNAAARRSWLARLVDEPGAASALDVRAPAIPVDLDRELARRPGVHKVSRRREKIAAFEENVARVIEIANGVLVFLAAAIACGMLLNGALVGLAERRTEVAVLRVQGFTRDEVADLLLYETTLTGLLGALLGIPLGCAMVAWVHSFTDTEILRVPYIVSTYNIARALLWSALFLTISHQMTKLLLRRQEWQASLSVKE